MNRIKNFFELIALKILFFVKRVFRTKTIKLEMEEIDNFVIFANDGVYNEWKKLITNWYKRELLNGNTELVERIDKFLSDVEEEREIFTTKERHSRQLVK